MAPALEKPAAKSNYLDHFGLTRLPFAPLSDPGEIHHVEQYSLLSSHLDAAAADTDHLVVLRGAEGSGKTTLLNCYVAGLDEATYFATVDQSCETEAGFYCTFLRQLGFNDITGKPGELRHIASEFLVHRARAGDSVLLIMDNVHHVRPTVLEQLRTLAGIAVDGRRVISTVITGNSHIRRIMDSPAMQGLRFREFVDFHIRAYTEQETGAYIGHRLRLAGATQDAIFTAESHAMIQRFSGGIPGQINKLCDALLTDAKDRKAGKIDDEFVRSVAESRQLPPHVIPVQVKGRRKSDGDTSRIPVPSQNGVTIASRSAPPAAPADTAQPAKSGNSRIDTTDLLARLARVSGQIERLKSEKQNAGQAISERDRTIAQLTDKLGEQSTEVRALEATVCDSADELSRLRNSLAESARKLDESASQVRKLTADLKSESRMAKSAQKKLERAQARIGRLEALQAELRGTVAELKKELEVSNEKASRVVVLQRELEIAGEKMGRVEELQDELAASREECARLQSAAVARVELEASLVEEDSQIGKLRGEVEAQNVGSTATLSMLTERPKIIEPPAAERAAGSGQENAISGFEVLRNGKVLRSMQREEVSARCMIGRGPDCDIRLESKYVSQHHALLICTMSSVAIEDLKSSNGTQVNSRRITRCTLDLDDVIRIGDFQIRAR